MVQIRQWSRKLRYSWGGVCCNNSSVLVIVVYTFTVSVAELSVGLVSVERTVRTVVLGRGSSSAGNTAYQGVQVHFVDTATSSR